MAVFNFLFQMLVWKKERKEQENNMLEAAIVSIFSLSLPFFNKQVE